MAQRAIPRRAFLLGLGALACDRGRAADPRQGPFRTADRLNERVQARLLRRGHLARERGANTPLEAFPVYHVAPAVPLAPAGWHLEVGGMVERPLRLSLEQLKRMTRTDLRVRHHCVEGWSAVASWHGVRLSDLAQAAGADLRAPYVDFLSFDAAEPDEPGGVAVPYSSSWDRESVLHPQTILAYGMNGEPLMPAHGAPLRLYSAVKLGYKMVKYLTRVRFLPQRTGGYWEDQGYEWFAGV